jgi:undecaprenyl-diphosphatase
MTGLGGRKQARAARPLPYLGILIAFGLFTLLALAVCLYGKPCFPWDLSVSRAVQAAPWPAGFEPFMRGVSLAGDDPVLAAILVLGACMALVVFRARREALVLLLAVGAEQVIKVTVKQFVARPRPGPELVNVLIDAKELYSFPSGHTVHYVVFLGFLWYLTFHRVWARPLRWPLLAVLGALVALIGLSRVYLGAHWVSDVLGGYLLGGAVLTTTVCTYRWWLRRAAPASREMRVG